MISLLPIPGGFFTLAGRCLSPSIVCPFKDNHLISRVLQPVGHTGLHILSASQRNSSQHQTLWDSGFLIITDIPQRYGLLYF